MTRTEANAIEQAVSDFVGKMRPGQSYSVFARLFCKVSESLGYRPVKAERTAGGACLVCGEDGRCIGYHLPASE